jgi:CRP-like cAMP-binding protein
MSRALSPPASPAYAASGNQALESTAFPKLAPEVAEIIARCGRRRTFAAGARILEAGSEARFYHFVESGAVAALDPFCGSERPVAFVGAGEMFSLDCGAQVGMTCVAVFPSVVIALDRRRLDEAARAIPALAALIRDTHAAELSRILECTERRRRTRTTPRQVWFEMASAAKSRFTACARAVERGSRAGGSRSASARSGQSGRYGMPPASRRDGMSSWSS